MIEDMDSEPSDTTVTSSTRKSLALTGSIRKIKDNTAEWHNMMMRWEKLNEEGFTIAMNIVNVTRSQSDRQLLEDSLTEGAAELQDKCCQLHDIIKKMVVMVTKMERLMTSQQGIQDLEEFQFGAEGRKFPLFHTWNTKQFGSLSQLLLDAFCQELRLKQTILQEVAHAQNRDLSLVYLSCWLHQPFIPCQTRLSLEALLLETGHRPL